MILTKSEELFELRESREAPEQSERRIRVERSGRPVTGNTRYVLLVATLNIVHGFVRQATRGLHHS
jgi:hypothetical protein